MNNTVILHGLTAVFKTFEPFSAAKPGVSVFQQNARRCMKIKFKQNTESHFHVLLKNRAAAKTAGRHKISSAASLYFLKSSSIHPLTITSAFSLSGNAPLSHSSTAP